MIHAIVDVLGNPIGFHLTPGQPHDLDGADKLLPGIETEKFLADKDHDAIDRIIPSLLVASKEPVVPSKCNRNEQRYYDDELYKARSLIEITFCKLKRFRAITTSYDKIACNFLAAIQLVASIIWLN